MDTSTTVANILSAHRGKPDALIPLLHDVQGALGYIPPKSLPAIAEALNHSLAELLGIIGYFEHFRLSPPGKSPIKICCAEACQSFGAEALAAHAQMRLRDSAFSAEPIYCLSQCSSGPAIRVGDKTIYTHVTPEKFDALIDALEADQQACCLTSASTGDSACASRGAIDGGPNAARMVDDGIFTRPD